MTNELEIIRRALSRMPCGFGEESCTVCAAVAAVERLEAERQEWREQVELACADAEVVGYYGDQLDSAIVCFLDKIAELRAQLAAKDALLVEARQDTARLDWREANPKHGFGLYADGTWADGCGGSHLTYRAAVDAAMSTKESANG